MNLPKLSDDIQKVNNDLGEQENLENMQKAIDARPTKLNLPKLGNELDKEYPNSTAPPKGGLGLHNDNYFTSLPSLPSLDLYEMKNESNLSDKSSESDNKTDENINEEIDETFQDLPEDYEIDNYDNESSLAHDEEFVDLNDSENNLEDEEFNQDDYNFLPIMDFEEEDNEETFENLLPGMNAKENNEIDNTENHKKRGKIPKNKQGKNFKEIDDESVKEFFNNLKNKLFKPKDKENDKKIKNKTSIKKPEIKEKIKANQDEGKPKDKFNIKKIIKGKYLTYITTFLVFAGAILLAFKFIGGTYKPLNELSIKVTQDDIKITLEEFTYDDKFTFTAINDGDMSASFFMDVKFKHKSGLKGEELVCQSDIIVLETDGKINEILHCEKFDKDLQYKITIDLVEIK